MRKPILILVSFLLIISGSPANTKAISCTCTKFAYDTKNSGNTDGQCPINPEKLALVWKTRVDPFTTERTYANIVCYNKKLIVSAGSRARCMNVSNAEEIWIFKANSRIASTPLIVGDYVFIPETGGKVNFLSMITGNVIYTGVTTGGVYSSPTYYGGYVYYTTDLGIVDCIDYTSGFERWWGATDGAIKSTPAFSDESIIFGTMRGTIYSISSTDANKIWSVSEESPVSTSASIFEDRFFIANEAKKLSCRKVKDGSLIWKQNFDGQIYSTPAIKNNCIFFGCTDGTFYCYDIDGKMKWSFKASDSIEGSCTLDGNTCYFGSVDGNIYALDQTTGKLVWSYKTDGRIQNTPTIAENRLFVNTSNGILYCFGDIDTLTKPELTKIEIRQSNSDCYINERIAFFAVGLDKNNNKIEDIKFQWSTEPEDIGKIDQQGIFTALKTGKCTVKATSGKISEITTINCIERIVPARLDINPKNVVLEFGKTIKFEATVFDNKGEVWNNPIVTWQCEPKTIGSIDTEGYFAAGETEAVGKVIIKAYGLTTNATVRIEEPKQAIIEITNPLINFESVNPGSAIQAKLKIKNTGSIADNIEISTSDQWLVVNEKKVFVEARSEVDVKLSIKSEFLKKNTSLSGKVIIQTSYGKSFEAKINISVNDGMPCYKTVDTLDFKKVQRGQSKTLDLQVSFSAFQSGKILSHVPWIRVSPDSFRNLIVLDIKVTVDANLLPAGERFEDYIEIVGNENCKESKVRVIVVTEKVISIKLKIGLAIATINGNSIPLAVAPQIVKGSTVVPLRLIGDAFGCKIDWDQSNKKITIRRNELEIILFVGSNESQINGIARKLTSPPIIISGKTMVPIRFIAEAFGAEVNYNSKTGEILILWEPS